MKLLWHTASMCSPDGCVEIAQVPGGRVAVRDSTDRGGPMLVFGPKQWDNFLAGARSGEFI
ncbi:DUF397 domain-containing protein [Nocardia gipuzkoensis]|nr:DUF397 domain-containing protein [Nocardia gipuzkoensis]MDE1675461.1 DUF397 domain-containing protein [Nocardia gipuzkoensis]